MVLEEKTFESVEQMARKPTNLGRTVRNVLLRAQTDKRTIVGVAAAVKTLSSAPEDALFCFLAPPSQGDSATHMQEVLLQAFCFENDIYIIKVDSSEKLSRILGAHTLESCALVQKAWTVDQTEELLTAAEEDLVDHCEAFWDAPNQPVVRLPEL
ncbi:growth arrest and DNA damage-inducible protein GADD45 alpha [Lutzomyia longipalpis]|uniref:Putative growth arrest and dna damage-inducible protein gadd45 alpha n=1 Tax=Lutzomyia longipalpis TaxID=7200 RepID=A0A1B0CGU0_LUTLO|nr:growth arrest and DNA damage-inducible protein GADD45 alpha [Lutzomyia longipalpis]